MAVNPYTSKLQTSNQVEFDMIEKLTIETIKFNGCDMYYLPREKLNYDYFYNEDVLSQFTDAILIEMYMDNPTEFGGDSELLTKFGLQVRDTADILVAMKRFKEEMTLNNIPIHRPREGDLIYFPLTNSVFEITFVEDKNPFFQAGKLCTYRMSCELFRYSSEKIETGLPEVDQLDDLFNNHDDAMTDDFASNTPIKEESSTIVDDSFDENSPFGNY